MAIEYIPFANFVDTGITSTESFDAWRQKINGVIVELSNQYSQAEIDADFVKLISTSQQEVTGDLYSSGVLKFNKAVSWDEGIYFPISNATVDTSTQRVFGDTINIAGVHSGEAIIVGDANGVNANIAFNAGKGIFEELYATGPTVTLNGFTYTVPTSTSSDAVLTITTGNVLSWSPKQAFIDAVIGSAQTFLSTDITSPVGSVIVYSGSAGTIPAGWVQDNQVVSAATYPQLAAVLGSSGGNVTIPNYATLHGAENGFIYIVKAKSNDVTAFNLVSGDGIQLYNTVDAPITTLNMASAGGKIGLKVTSQFGFDGAGALKIAANAVTTTEILNGAVTPAKLSTGAPTWDTAGNVTVSTNIRSNDPISANHAVTKGYLDQKIDDTYGRFGRALLSGGGAVGCTSVGYEYEFAWMDNAYNLYAVGYTNLNSKWGYSEPKQLAQYRVINDANSSDISVNINSDTFHVLNNGKIYAMGRNDLGQLGRNTATFSNTTEFARCFSTSKTFTKLICAVGYPDAANFGALASDGTFHIAGANTYGQLGKAGNTQHTSQSGNLTYQVSGIPTVSQAVIVGGWWTGVNSYDTTVAILGQNGTLWTWGHNQEGLLAIGSTDNTAHSTPTQVTLPGTMGSITTLTGGGSVSNKFLAIIDNAGSLWTWGSRTYGQLGLGGATTAAVTTPTLSWNAATLGTVHAISFSNARLPSTFIIAGATKKLYVCGRNYDGQLGLGETSLNANVTAWTPVTPTWESDGFTEVVKAWHSGRAVSYQQTSFVLVRNTTTQAKALYTFGRNDFYQNGTGRTGVERTAVRVPFNADTIEDITTHYSYTVIKTTDGRAYYAGRRYFFSDAEGWDGGYTDFFTPIPNTRSY